MKTLILFLGLFTFFQNSVYAQPQSFKYQAVVRDKGGIEIANSAVSFQLSILSGSATGNIVYQEKFFTQTNDFGLVSLEVGKGKVELGDFSKISWETDLYFLEIAVDYNNSGIFDFMGTSQLLSVPYALYSGYSDSAIHVKITGTEAAFNSFDKDTTDDFDGDYNKLTNAPKGLSSFVNDAGFVTVNTSTDTSNTNELQTLSDVLMKGNSANTVISNITDPVNAQDAATKNYVDQLEAKVIALENILIDNGSYIVSDIDGNKYNVVRIGSQVWMTQNLRVTHYNDGGKIPNITDNNAWINTLAAAYCWGNNDSVTYSNPYGALYNWHVASSNKICPQGWHVPSDVEWAELETYVGGNLIAGGALKENGIMHWQSPNFGATNSTGFSALGSGLRSNTNGAFTLKGGAYYWSSTKPLNFISAYTFQMGYNDTKTYRVTNQLLNGHSIRCLKD